MSFRTKINILISFKNNYQHNQDKNHKEHQIDLINLKRKK